MVVDACGGGDGAGISTQPELLFLAIDSVFEAPELSARRLHQQKKPSGVPHFIGLLLGLGISDRRVGQRHRGGHFHVAWDHAENRPQSGPQILRLSAKDSESQRRSRR